MPGRVMPWVSAVANGLLAALPSWATSPGPAAIRVTTCTDEALVSRGRGRALLRDGVGILRAIDDGPLTLVESTEAATAFTLLDDGSLIVAMDQPDKTRLVRIDALGTATVVAEEDSTIEALAADPRTGVVWAGGAFGLVAYR